MPLSLYGNTEYNATDANGSYLSGKGVVLNDAGYLATDNKAVIAVVYSRGGSASANSGCRFAIYESPDSNIANATLVFSMAAAHTGAAWSKGQRFVLDPVFKPVAGRYYWFLITRVPGGYLYKAATTTHQQLQFPLASPYDPPAALSALTTTAVASEGVFYVEVVDLLDRTVTTLGAAPVADSQHIARFSNAAHRATGVQVEHSLFTSNGSAVTVNADGSFVLSDGGDQTFAVRFSTDSGATWSAEQALTINDLTA